MKRFSGRGAVWRRSEPEWCDRWNRQTVPGWERCCSRSSDGCRVPEERRHRRSRTAEQQNSANRGPAGLVGNQGAARIERSALAGQGLHRAVAQHNYLRVQQTQGHCAPGSRRGRATTQIQGIDAKTLAFGNAEQTKGDTRTGLRRHGHRRKRHEQTPPTDHRSPHNPSRGCELILTVDESTGIAREQPFARNRHTVRL